MRTVCIIPARGGSKGIPGKNLVPFCGKPLLAWTILQAKAARQVTDVYVSSNEDAILGVAQDYGAIPIVRPAHLAIDSSSSEEALAHALAQIESSGSNVDLVVFLQATSPLREPEDIDKAVRKLLADEADALFSMSVLDDFCAWAYEGNELKGVTYDPLNRGRRQDRKPFYLENGSIYLFKPDVLKKCGNRFGGKIAMFEMPLWKSYEIDKEEDLEICEYFFSARLLDAWRRTPRSSGICAENIDLIVYDFDGVMTDNRVLTLQDGSEAVFANRSDGLAINRIKAFGIPQVIVSTEENPVVEARAQKIGIPAVHGVKDKWQALCDYMQENRIARDRALFIGNDLNDMTVMKALSMTLAPSDAHPAIRAAASYVLESKGGAGVVSELADILLNSDNYERRSIYAAE
jgi:N-acylneuraminate cytidylyltransferase